MKLVFGMVSLLVALAVAGVLVSRQLRTAGQGAAAPAPGDSSRTAAPASSRAVQEQVRNEVVKSLEEGARRHESDN